MKDFLNNVENEVVTKESLQLFFVNSTKIKVSSDILISVLNHLTSNYFFYKSTYHVTNDMILNSNMTNVGLNDSLIKPYIVCIDIHNRICVVSEELYELIAIPNGGIFNIMSIDELRLFCANVVTPQIDKKPVYIYLTADKKNYFNLWYDCILLILEANNKFEVKRSIFDMLYAEHEDFNPTTSEVSGVIIHSEVRHQLKFEGCQVTDLLHSDISMICDTQDKLVEEFFRSKIEK